MPTTSIAQPPVGMHAPAGIGWVFTVLMAAQIVPAAAWLIRKSVRERTVLPVLALLGGAAAAFIEPMFDSLSDIWWPTNIPLTAFTAFGVHVPSYVLMGYCLFLGVGSYWVFERIRDGKDIWLPALVFFVADLLYEVPFTRIGLYKYYGPQPFNPLGFPFYWAFLNAMVVIVGGWMFYMARDRMVGWGRFAAFAIPVLALGPLMGSAWPTFLALHMDMPQVGRWIAASFTIVTSVGIVGWISDQEHAPAVTHTGRLRPAGSQTQR